MKSFVQRHQDQILGVLSGFDRLRFRGVLRLLQSEGGTATWLERVGVAVKDFLKFAEGLTKRLCRGMDQLAEEAGRKARYLPGVVDKEELVQEIRGKEGVADNGLVAVLKTQEMGMSYTMFRSRGFPVLRRGPRRCNHYYCYWEDERFGLMHVRMSSWAGCTRDWCGTASTRFKAPTCSVFSATGCRLMAGSMARTRAR